MCSGVSLSWRDLPDALVETHELRNRFVSRSESADREIHFLYRDRRPLLPAWYGGQMTIVEWGSRNPSSTIPRTGWCKQESLEAGRWEWLHPEPIEIPAAFALEQSVWYQVDGGLRGVLIHDANGAPHAYVLTQPASHYYHVMTRHERMPVFVGNGI